MREVHWLAVRLTAQNKSIECIQYTVHIDVNRGSLEGLILPKLFHNSPKIYYPSKNVHL